MKKHLKNLAASILMPLRRFFLKDVLAKLDLYNSSFESLAERIESLREEFRQSLPTQQQVLDILKADHDNINNLRKALWKVRETSTYKETWAKKNPLITVRIATYNGAELLIERAISSVLKQTYQNFEIIVIGDHCTDDTEERIKALKDKRIVFYNFPSRNLYPDDKHYHWMVAGSPGMNLGAHMAKGLWVAPLDHDDEFSPDHIELLLKHALKEKAELVHGSLDQVNLVTKKVETIWSSPPEISKFSFQGAMYMKVLDEVFNYDQQSWVMREPGDWNLCRRMMLAGVRMSAIKDKVGVMYMTPYTEKKEN